MTELLVSPLLPSFRSSCFHRVIVVLVLADAAAAAAAAAGAAAAVAAAAGRFGRSLCSLGPLHVR